MVCLRGVLFIGAMLIALPAFAVDPIFNEELARAAFLKTEAGRAIVREVIRDARGAPEWLNRQHYRSFLIALDYTQNRALAHALEDHLTKILAPVQDLREAHGGAAPTNPIALKKEEEMVIRAAEREFQNPGLMDLAGIAQEPILEAVPMAMRAAVQEAMPVRRRARAIRSAVPEAMLESVPDTAQTLKIPGLPEETGGLDLYPNNPKMKRGRRAQAQILRDLFLLIYKYVRDSKNGVLPTPEGFTPLEAREYHRQFYINVRQFVRMLDGYNDYARDQYVYEIFTNVKRPAYAALNLASREVLRQYTQGEISITKLIEAQKKIVEANNLDIPEVTWEAHKRILYTIERLTQLCGTIVDGRIVPGEIAETTRNLKHDQEQLVEIEKDLASLREKLAKLKAERPVNQVELRKTQQQILNRQMKAANWNKRTRRLVNLLAGYYTEVVQLRPRVELFNHFRQGLMSKGMISETFVGALDMTDAFVVATEVNEHWRKFQDYAEGTLMSLPGLPDVELPNISARVMPLLVKGELSVLRNRVLNHNKDFANTMNKLCVEATGQGLRTRSSMTDLATFIVAADAKLTFIKKALGLGTTGTVMAGWFHSEIGSFMGWCSHALQRLF